MVDFDANMHIFRSPTFRGAVEEAVDFFANTPVHTVPPPDDPRVIGPGVYALYYLGDYELYGNLTQLNRSTCVHPIYAGKAVPLGWRTARVSLSESKELFHRLNQHAASIQQGADLYLDDFRCRFMILNDIESDLVGPVEAALIRTYRPLWNSVVDGFGNHDPGKGHYNQAKSQWDVLHPGRYWAERLTGASPGREDVIREVSRALDELLLP